MDQKKQQELYKDFTIEKFTKAISEFFNKPSKLSIEELKAKVLTGYFYTIKNEVKAVPGTRNVTLGTGSGGVLLYIDTCVEKGITNADIIAESIFVHTDNHGLQNIANVSVTRKENK